MIKGVDVAKYQGNIDWTKAKADGVRFAILKAIDKSNNKESSFEKNYAGCIANNIPVGVYNYSYATSVEKAKKDARALLLAIAGKNIQMKVWLDVEDSCQKNLKTLLIDIINTYKKEIEEAGYEFGVYTGLSFYNTYIKKYGDVSCPLWIARYPSSATKKLSADPDEKYKPNIGKDIFAWQYSSKGSVNGIAGNCDLNVLYAPIANNVTTNIQKAENEAKKLYKIGNTYTLDCNLWVRTAPNGIKKHMRNLLNQHKHKRLELVKLF